MQSTTSQEEWADKGKLIFTEEESRLSLRRMWASLRQNQDQDEHLRLRRIGNVIRWIEMAANIGTMNVAGCSGDTRLMMPSLQHIVTTRIHLDILFNLPSFICEVKSILIFWSGLLVYLPVPNLVCKCPHSPLWSDPAAASS